MEAQPRNHLLEPEYWTKEQSHPSWPHYELREAKQKRPAFWGSDPVDIGLNIRHLFPLFNSTFIYL